MFGRKRRRGLSFLLFVPETTETVFSFCLYWDQEILFTAEEPVFLPRFIRARLVKRKVWSDLDFFYVGPRVSREIITPALLAFQNQFSRKNRPLCSLEILTDIKLFIVIIIIIIIIIIISQSPWVRKNGNL